MILAFKKIIPPKEWHHDPLLRCNNYTVATIFIRNNILPPKEWEHIIKEDDIPYLS